MWYDISFHKHVGPVQFDFEAYHGTDVLPSFWTNEVNFKDFLKVLLKKLKPKWKSIVVEAVADLVAAYMGNPIDGFGWTFQRRLAMYAVFGDPNIGKKFKVKWPPAVAEKDGEHVDKVLHVQPTSWDTVKDPRNVNSTCGFWSGIAAQINPTSEDTIEAEAKTSNHHDWTELK